VTVDPIPKALIFCMRPRTVLEARMKNPTPDMAAVGRTGADSESPYVPGWMESHIGEEAFEPLEDTCVKLWLEVDLEVLVYRRFKNSAGGEAVQSLHSRRGAWA
jgi:hypothetical protein